MSFRGNLLARVAVIVAVTAAPATADDESQLDPSECPEAFRSVAVSLHDVRDGVAFDFKTPRKQHVATLRRLLREAAVVLEHHTKTEAMRTDVQRMPDDFVLPALDIAVRDVAAGVRVTVRAEARRDLPDVRANARLFRRVWHSHPCVRGPAPSLAHRGHGTRD